MSECFPIRKDAVRSIELMLDKVFSLACQTEAIIHQQQPVVAKKHAATRLPNMQQLESEKIDALSYPGQS